MEDVPTQSVALHRSGNKRFDENVEFGKHAHQNVLTLRRLKVEGNIALPAAVDLPPKWLTPCCPLPKWIACTGLLHLHNVGAKVRKEHTCKAARHHSRQV
jgi:hypothetical protein